MRQIVDFHLHSKYSRACSALLTIPNIAVTCERKGIDIVGTSDFTHPAWRAHLEEELEQTQGGLYTLRNGTSRTKFLLSTEVSCIYKQHEKTRRVHHIILFPDLASVDRFRHALTQRDVNIVSDGRPIMGIRSDELVKIAYDASDRMIFIPAHVWTPWYSVFGSQSGFDSLEECFGDMTPYIHAIETGLSSDPPMNRMVSALDDLLLVSNSDAHSLDKLGREANVFEMDEPSYDELFRIITKRDRSKCIETIEFFPEEGKYHADGHRSCSFWCEPNETRRLNGRCPTCGKPLVIGVFNRVHALADRAISSSEGIPNGTYRSIIPLAELIAQVLAVGPYSKRVRMKYDELIHDRWTEFFVLLDEPYDSLLQRTSRDIAQAIISMREGRVDRSPGYDGVFGVIRVRTQHVRTQTLAI